jgi:hypothetical protein
MVSAEELNRLLDADESDTLERKASLADTEGIRNSMIAFANDLAGRGGGTIIIGQNPDKTVGGLRVGADEAQQTISRLARNRSYPAIHVIIEICEHASKNLAIVEVKASAAKPHFRGECYVRQGSTNRVATDAEIMVLHAATSDPKVRQLLKWQQEGKMKVTCVQLPTGTWGRVTADLVEVTDTYVSLSYNPTFTLTVPLSNLQLGYDSKNQRPQVSFRRED